MTGSDSDIETIRDEAGLGAPGASGIKVCLAPAVGGGARGTLSPGTRHMTG